MINNPMQIFQMLQNSSNPKVLLNQIFGNNPQFSQIMQIVNKKSPEEIEQYVRNLYKSQGLDIKEMASQFGINLTA